MAKASFPPSPLGGGSVGELDFQQVNYNKKLYYFIFLMYLDGFSTNIERVCFSRIILRHKIRCTLHFQAMSDFRKMFPSMDADVIEAVLRANRLEIEYR